MKYRRLINGDYSFGRGKSDYLSDIDAVAQAIVTRLLLLKGEWWEDLNDGLPLFQEILGVSRSMAKVDRLISERILDTENVIDISDIDTDFNAETRKYVYGAKVDTEFGSMFIEGEL